MEKLMKSSRSRVNKSKVVFKVGDASWQPTVSAFFITK